MVCSSSVFQLDVHYFFGLVVYFLYSVVSCIVPTASIWSVLDRVQLYRIELHVSILCLTANIYDICHKFLHVVITEKQ